MRSSDWSSDVCSSDLGATLYADDTLRGFGVRLAYTWIDLRIPETQPVLLVVAETMERRTELANDIIKGVIIPQFVVLPVAVLLVWFGLRSEEHTSELQSLMRISYAVFCLKKKTHNYTIFIPLYTLYI